jgi:hypothetical protein
MPQKWNYVFTIAGVITSQQSGDAGKQQVAATLMTQINLAANIVQGLKGISIDATPDSGIEIVGGNSKPPIAFNAEVNNPRTTH